MVEAAEADGRLEAGGSVVEYTGGSTGVSLSLVCAVKGYPAHIVTSDAFAREKLDHMEFLGAKLEIVKSDSGLMTEKLTRDMIAAAAVLARKPGSFWTDQLNNTDQLGAYHLDGGRDLDADRRKDRRLCPGGSVPPDRSGVSPKHYAATTSRSASSPWSRPSPRSCRVARPVPTRSTGSARVSSCRCGTTTSPTRWIRFRPKRPWPWPLDWRERKASLPGPPPAPTSPRP